MRRTGRKKRRLAPQRRERKWWKAICGLLTALALLAISQAGYHALLDSPYFKLKEIRVIGLSPGIASEVQKLVQQKLGDNPSTLALPVAAIRESLLGHPKLTTVNVEVAYPHTLVVTGTERKPSAIVAADHAFYLVGRDGVVISTVRPTELRDYPLPYITGIPADRLNVGQKVSSAGLARALDMLDLLRDRNAELYSRFSEVHIHQDPITKFDNVTARLRGGTEVFFGTSNPSEKLPLLDLFIQQRIKEDRDPYGVAYIDLRVPGQIICLDKMAVGKERIGEPDQAFGKLPSAVATGPQSADSAKDEQRAPSRAGRQNNERDKAHAQVSEKNMQKSTREGSTSSDPALNTSEQGTQQATPDEMEQQPRRPRLPFKFFTKRSRDPVDAPLLRPPVDAEPSD